MASTTGEVKVAITMDNKITIFKSIFQNCPLAAVIGEACEQWKLTDADNYALQFSEPMQTLYVTERNRVEMRNGHVLKLVHSASLTAKATIDALNSEADALQQMKKLSDLCVDITFAQEFILKGGHKILIGKIESQTYCGELLALTLKTFVELMDHGIVSWDIIEPRFIHTVSNPVNTGRSTSNNDATALQSALEILESVVMHSQLKAALVEQEVTPMNLIHHLTSPNTDIQKNVLALINALFMKADMARKKTIADNIQAKATRNIIQTSVIRTSSSDNEDTCHQLYILQCLLLSLLEGRCNSAPDPNDQNCARDIQELRRVAFESEMTSLPGGSKTKNPPSKDYKKLGFTNCHNPVEDFALTPPGVLALECIVYFARMQAENYTKVVLENSCRADDSDLPFARASIALCNDMLDILQVGEPISEEGGQYQPMFFTNERPFEELFTHCIQLLNKTWREMRAKTADFTKVLRVVRDQITRALADQPSTFEDFRKSLAKLNFTEMNKIYHDERHIKEQWELQAAPIVELREEIKPEMMELIKQQRLNFLVEGTAFTQKGRHKLRHWFCRLSPNHKVLYYGDCEDERTSPTIEQLPNKIPVVDIKCVKTGKECAHVTADRKKAIPPHLAFSIEWNEDNPLQFVAPDDTVFTMWIDGLNVLLGNPMTSDLTNQDLETLLGMEIKLRLLETEGITIPEHPPPIPPPPPNYDFVCRAV